MYMFKDSNRTKIYFKSIITNKMNEVKYNPNLKYICLKYVIIS